MRRVFIMYLLCAAAAGAGAQTPAAPAPPAAPPASEYAAFDAGTRISFYAEQNIFTAYLLNPADAALLPATFVGGDFGGDLSFGGFNYKRNHGSAGPGPTNPEEDAGLEVSYTAGLGGRALGAYRYDFLTVGGALDINRTAANFGYNGASLTVDPFFATGDGWTDVDIVGQRYEVAAVGAAAFEPHFAGLAFSFAPERVEGQYNFEFLPASGVAGSHQVEEVWGRREIKDYTIKGGYSFRPGEAYDVGGAFGVRVLRSTLDWREKKTEEVAPTFTDEGNTGAVKLRAPAYTVDVNGRYRIRENVRVGGALAMQFLPGITLDWRGERWDLVGPFGERSSEDYRLAKGGERHYRLGGGVAFYPDAKTTLAFDYGFDRFSVNADVYDAGGEVIDELALATYHTFTQLGLERWLSDALVAKVGWRQDLFGLPRNVFFGGLAYKFDDDWFINYDYVGQQLTINNLSLFVPLEDVVKPASHRFTVVRYF